MPSMLKPPCTHSVTPDAQNALTTPANTAPAPALTMISCGWNLRAAGATTASHARCAATCPLWCGSGTLIVVPSPRPSPTAPILPVPGHTSAWCKSTNSTATIEGKCQVRQSWARARVGWRVPGQPGMQAGIELLRQEGAARTGLLPAVILAVDCSAEVQSRRLAGRAGIGPSIPQDGRAWRREAGGVRGAHRRGHHRKCRACRFRGAHPSPGS